MWFVSGCTIFWYVPRTSRAIHQFGGTGAVNHGSEGVAFGCLFDVRLFDRSFVSGVGLCLFRWCLFARFFAWFFQ